ncbi:MAG TPA: nucleoside kinase [Anaerolineales bacterium]|nr:nucleoside kinase [Anaerolineales bacterium]
MQQKLAEFRLVEPRPTVEIHLQDGQVIEGPRNARLEEFLRPYQDFENAPIVGAVVNGALRELSIPIEMDSRVKLLTMKDEDGMRIYRRSLTFLLVMAFEELYPALKLTIDHSVAAGGYFCQVEGGPPLTAEQLSALENRMRAIVDADLPIKRDQVPLAQAIENFRRREYEDKVRLLAHRQKDYLMLYSVGDHCDYLHGYMVPSTGYIRWFALASIEDGFTLRFPRRRNPTGLLPLPDYPRMLSTFRQYGDWLEYLGIDSVGALNDAILGGRIRELILVSDALHEQRISEIASQVYREQDRIRVITIAGPTSSGKTTFSKRLSVQLLTHGISPFPLEMDNYFVDRESTPKDEHGEYDFESIYSLDRVRLSRDLGRIIAGERVRLPRYNFKTGLSEAGEEVQLDRGQIVILEGIHGLNPALIPEIPAESTYRIYVSALTQLNLDRHNRVSTTDTRLLRRVVRDVRERGHSAVDTIRRWASVGRGEKRWIFPFQENADVMFNSALVYELSALKPLAEPLIRQIAYGTPEHIEGKRLLSLLEWFLPLDSNLVPDDSLLREFIGGSMLSDFRLWQNHR